MTKDLFEIEDAATVTLYNGAEKIKHALVKYGCLKRDDVYKHFWNAVQDPRKCDHLELEVKVSSDFSKRTMVMRDTRTGEIIK